MALNNAFRGIWIEKSLEWGHVYWDEADIEEMESLTLLASEAVEGAWQALSAVIDAHTAQEEAEFTSDDED